MSCRLPAMIGGIAVVVVAVVVVDAQDDVDHEGVEVVGAAHDEVEAQLGRLCKDSSERALSPPTCLGTIVIT